MLDLSMVDLAETASLIDGYSSFTDKTMTLAAIERLVHHATILEMNVESYRRKVALKRKRGKAD